MLQKLLSRNMFATQAKLGGNLYTWGKTSLGSGIDHPTQRDQMVPRLVPDFKGNVARVVTGLQFTAVITTSGDLYTFGENGHGQLGIGTRNDTLAPTRVETFANLGLKVVDVALGYDHALAITDDGTVWSWGWSGKSRIPFYNNFVPPASGVGVTATDDLLSPTRIDNLNVKPQTISAGAEFSILYDADNHLWGWGQGQFGQLGNGIRERLTYPYRNPAWDQKIKKENSTVRKLRSAHCGTVALLENGKLIGWGSSRDGHLGVRLQEFIRDDENTVPMDVNQRYMHKGEKVVDFDLSQDGLIYYTNENNVYFTGAGMYFVPNLVQKGKDVPRVSRVAASRNALAFLTENGDLYASENFIEPYFNTSEHHIFQRLSQADLFNGGKVLDIGGSYLTRFAIVQN